MPEELKLTGRVASILLVALIAVSIQHSLFSSRIIQSVHAELIPLNSVLPKMEALHDEARALLIRNAELKSKILVGLQAQNEAKIKIVKSSRLLMTPGLTNLSSVSINQINTEQSPPEKTSHVHLKQQQQLNVSATGKAQVGQQGKDPIALASKQQQQTPALTMKQKGNSSDPASKSMIDFGELEDFNKWVEINLLYAVKNTQASAEALRDEALQNNGTVDYSIQAIKDGMEGVKYWQSAVSFQDKTLRNEKFDAID